MAKDGTGGSAGTDSSGGDAPKASVLAWMTVGAFILLLAIPVWWLPRRAAERRHQNEMDAGSAILLLARAEGQFINPALKGRNGFWVGDVSGLYRGKDSSEGLLQLVDVTLADADWRPLSDPTLAPRTIGAPKARSGYFYVAITHFEYEGKSIPYDDGTHLNREAFGFAAFPSDYPSNGRRTFIVDRGNQVWWKDIGGIAPELFPEQPGRAGWSR
jgi:hypothetical protein